MDPPEAQRQQEHADSAHRHARQLLAVSELGVEALVRPHLRALAQTVADAVAEAMEVDIVTVDELLEDGDLIARATVGLGSAVRQGERASRERGSLAGYTLLAREPVISADLSSDPRFLLRPSLRALEARAGLSVPVGPPGAAWGILITARTDERAFSEQDIAFVQSVANLLWAVVQLERNERELQRLAEAVEQASDAIISIDLEGRIRHWNRGAERLLGMPADEVIGRSLDEFNTLTGESGAADGRSKEAIERVLGTGVGSYYESQRHREDGSVLELSVAVTPWRIDGQIAGVTNVVTEITDRKRAEQSNARLAAIVEASDDAIIGKTLTGEITSWNPAAERIYGYSAAEAIGRDISILVPPQRLDELAQIMRSVAGGVPVKHRETIRRRKSGQTIEVSVTVSPVHDPQGEIVGAATVARDISDVKQNERARDQAIRDLAEAQRLARLGSWTWYPETDEGTWSPQMYEIFDRDPVDGPAVGETFFAYLHPEDREQTVAAYGQTFGGGDTFESEFRVLHRNGDTRYLLLLGYQDPAIAGRYFGTVQDVTDQRRAERERAEMLAATVRAESANRAKSEFLARMSHELRTPLNSIMGFSQLLELDELEQRQHERVTYVLKASRHLLDLINEVLDLAGIEAGRLSFSPEPVALAELVHEAVALVTPLAAEAGVQLEVDDSGLADDGHVTADRNRLKQVLLNVLTNAIKYNRAGGRVLVSYEMQDGRVLTTIADTGMGIAAERLPGLFEPFERLGAEMTEIEGTGLGLSLAKGLLEAMNGTIDVESTLGEGTSVMIGLAAARRPTAEPTRIETRTPVAVSELGETILYIEDNLSNLTLVEQILEQYGDIKLIPAMQGTIGIELARQHQPALIVLDLHLPDMPGTDVLKQLKGDPLTSGIPVVVLTADAVRDQSGRAHTLGAAHYLTKPLDVTLFLEVVSQTLAAARDRPA